MAVLLCRLGSEMCRKESECLRSLRKGGNDNGTTFKRKNKSCRNLPSSTSFSRSRFVAAISRMSTLNVLLPPTRSNDRSCNTRKSFTCTPGLKSPTSSRRSVPPSANSNRPLRVCVAEVKAPFSCPNNSDSINVSGNAAQLTATNGPLARGLSWWMARASISFPVPFSPLSKTVALVAAATERACFKTVSRDLLVPTDVKPGGRGSSARNFRFSLCCRIREAWLTICKSSAASNGFQRNRRHPV